MNGVVTTEGHSADHRRGSWHGELYPGFRRARAASDTLASPARLAARQLQTNRLRRSLDPSTDRSDFSTRGDYSGNMRHGVENPPHPVSYPVCSALYLRCPV
jgi:hypothetical protein